MVEFSFDEPGRSRLLMELITGLSTSLVRPRVRLGGGRPFRASRACALRRFDLAGERSDASEVAAEKERLKAVTIRSLPFRVMRSL